MTVLTQHAPGTFCWPELATSDQNAAKKFYAEIFGWTYADQDMGPHGIYTIAQVGGKDAAALFTMTPDMKGMPPYWGAYVAVTSADEAAAHAASLGGTVMMQPFDVMDKGRMAVIKDAEGAVFSVWQANTHNGIGVMSEPGSLSWTELLSHDTGTSGGFYTRMFNWSHMEMPFGPQTYHVFSRPDGAMAARMMQMPPEAQAPSNWMSYFEVADCDAAANKITALGGKIWVQPQDAEGVGRFAVASDPQGAMFAIIKSAPRG